MAVRVNHHRDPGDGPGVPPGLCGGCRHVRRIETRVGSIFHLCQRASSDPAYPRYPRLPTLSCRGFERATEAI